MDGLPRNMARCLPQYIEEQCMSEDDTFRSLKRLTHAQLSERMRQEHLIVCVKNKAPSQIWYRHAQDILKEYGWTNEEYMCHPDSKYFISKDHYDQDEGYLL